MFSYERSLTSTLSNAPKIIFISHLQLLQISTKAKFHGFSAILSFNQPRLKINSLTLYKMNFHTQNVSKKVFHWMGASAVRSRVPGWARTPHSNEKSFLENFKSENWFCKKSRNLFWVEADWSLKWLKSCKNHEIWLRLKFEAAVDVIWKWLLLRSIK